MNSELKHTRRGEMKDLHFICLAIDLENSNQCCKKKNENGKGQVWSLNTDTSASLNDLLLECSASQVR